MGSLSTLKKRNTKFSCLENTNREALTVLAVEAGTRAWLLRRPVRSAGAQRAGMMQRPPLPGVFAEAEKLSTDHAGDRAASLTRGRRPGAQAVTTRHLDLSHGALDNPHGCCLFLLVRPELLSQTVNVAPRALPFKWSSGLHGLVGSTLPQSHAALGKNRAGP